MLALPYKRYSAGRKARIVDAGTTALPLVARRRGSLRAAEAGRARQIIPATAGGCGTLPQVPMPPLENARWERFVQELARGKSQTEV
jgi:hypothetical protein